MQIPESNAGDHSLMQSIVNLDLDRGGEPFPLQQSTFRSFLNHIGSLSSVSDRQAQVAYPF